MLDIQKKIISLCTERSQNEKVVHTLSRILNLSKDATYRRMRGDKLLDIRELSLICEYYNLSFDQFIYGNGNQVGFDFSPLYENLDYESFLLRLLSFLNEVKDNTSCKITIVAMDLPLFRELNFECLASFVYFYWNKTVLQKNEFKSLKFSNYEINSRIKSIIKEICKCYSYIPSTEIWSPQTIVSTLKRIEYYHSSGLIGNPDLAKEILEDVKRLINQLKEESESGIKYTGSNHSKAESPVDISLYLSEVYLTNNLYQMNLHDQTYSYLTYNSINSLTTTNKRVNEECNQWINHIRTNSVLLSQVSQRQRLRFFNKLENDINSLSKKLHLN